MSEPPFTEIEEFADETAFVKTATAAGIVGRKDLLLPLPHRRSYIEYVNTVNGAPDSGYWATPEGQQELAYWKSPSGQNALKAIEGPHQLLAGLTELITKYSDTSTVECLKREYGSLRDFFETSSPTTQCGNTIRGVQPNNTICWICGVKITGFPGAGTFRMLELGPECEHVFPIAQALCFAGLYETQLYKQIAEEKGVNEADAYREGVTYEYQWSHRICNQIKNDTHFIVYDGNKFSIDGALLETFLADLQTTPKYGGGANLMRLIKQETEQTPDQWRDSARARMKEISERLINYANTSGLTPEQHAKITLMAVRSFISTSPKCAGAVEVIPDVVMVYGSPRELPAIKMSAPVDTAKHFIAVVTESLTVIMERALDKVGRAISARDKGALIALLPDAGLIIRQNLEERFTYLQLNAARAKIFYYLKSKYGARITEQEPWSKFQVWTSQVIPGLIYQAVAQAPPVVKASIPTLAPLMDSPLLATEIATWLSEIIVKIKGAGVPYDEIIVVDPNVDPASDVPNPPWFGFPAVVQQAGGNDKLVFPKELTLVDSHLGGRRPLYSKNARSTSHSVPRTKQHARLRERSWPRHTYRVRQHTGGARTWRQRKHLDRL